MKGTAARRIVERVLAANLAHVKRIAFAQWRALCPQTRNMNDGSGDAAPAHANEINLDRGQLGAETDLDCGQLGADTDLDRGHRSGTVGFAEAQISRQGRGNGTLLGAFGPEKKFKLWGADAFSPPRSGLRSSQSAGSLRIELARPEGHVSRVDLALEAKVQLPCRLGPRGARTLPYIDRSRTPSPMPSPLKTSPLFPQPRSR